MCRTIVITSGKGGVGKTTISANLGLNLCKLRKRVCIIDMDIGLNNLDVVLGLEGRAVFSLLDVIEGKCRLCQALITDDDNPLLNVLTTGNLIANNDIKFNDIKNIIFQLKDKFDYILIDCPAGIDGGFQRAVAFADEAIVVTTPHLSSMRDADKVISILASFDIESMRFVVNRARGDLIKSQSMLDVYDIARTLHIDFAGVIPEDDNISKLLNVGGNKFDLRNSSTRAFMILAENIEHGTKKLYDCTYKYRGLFGGVKAMLKRNA